MLKPQCLNFRIFTASLRVAAFSGFLRQVLGFYTLYKTKKVKILKSMQQLRFGIVIIFMVSFVDVNILNNKETLHVYSTQVFSKLKWRFAIFILCLNTEKNIQSSENEYHDESCTIKVYRSVWFKEGSKLEKCNFKVHFKGPNFAQVINPCANSIS